MFDVDDIRGMLSGLGVIASSLGVLFAKDWFIKRHGGPLFEFERWSIQLNVKHYRPLNGMPGGGVDLIMLSWWWPRAKGYRFGYVEDWYDGWHRSFTVGPINLYWNF